LGSVAGNGGAAVKDRWKKVGRGRSVKREQPEQTFVNDRHLRQVVTLDATGLPLEPPDPAQTVNPKRVFALCAPSGANGPRASRLVAGFLTGANAARQAPIEQMEPVPWV
jgi:hypothetical protein